jgi:hypothetical protein
MFEIFLSPYALPFSLALLVVAGLFLLEILSAVFGASIMGIGGGDGDIDIDADFDLTPDMDFDAPDLGMEGIDGVEGLDGSGLDSSGPDLASPTGVLGWIGLQSVPFLIWLVTFLTFFGLSGLFIQSLFVSVFGAGLPPALASLVAAVPALLVTRVVARWVSLMMPKTETSALKARNLGGYRGVISQGTAMRGKPAEAKIKDRYDNIHYLRVEPLDDDGVFPQGSDVMIVRKTGDKFFVI